MGHDVTVVTTFPNHPTGIIPEGYRGHLRLIEHDQGVRVVRTFLYAAANKGVIKRGLCYSPRHGDLAFTVPMFDSFVRRAL